MKKAVYRTIMALSTSRWVSTMLRAFAKSQISRPLVKPFAKWIKFDQTESETELKNFDSLHEFFTRQLNEGARPVAGGKYIITSPSDGKLTAAGRLTGNETFKVKGTLYSLKKLLGKEKLVETYKQGSYAVIYLAPHNYHRVHAPVTGRRLHSYALGSLSEPVNQWGLTYGKNPLSGNYRLITEIATSFGRSSVIKVGAVNVNSIQLTTFSETIQKGEELGYFSFGSTVILLFESQDIEWIETGDDLKRVVHTGERIAQLTGV